MGRRHHLVQRGAADAHPADAVVDELAHDGQAALLGQQAQVQQLGLRMLVQGRNPGVNRSSH